MRPAAKRRAALFLIAAAALLGCPAADALMAGVAPDSPTVRIDPNTADSQFAGVGAVVVGSSPYSGVVIARQYVLTAAHVASASASTTQFVLNIGGTAAWTTTVDSIAVYPTFNFPYDDLAVLKLTNPVPAGVPIYPLYSGALVSGLTVVLAGYGASGAGNVGVTVPASAQVKRSGANIIDSLQSTLDGSGRSSSFFVYDFDGPTGNGPSGGGTIGNGSETMVSVGDSGSPAFVRGADGVLQLLGINTFVSQPAAGAPIDYKFGMQAGGIVASDAQFAPWLQSETLGTMPGSAMQGDGPLPFWAGALLAVALAGIGMWRITEHQQLRT